MFKDLDLLTIAGILFNKEGGGGGDDSYNPIEDMNETANEIENSSSKDEKKNPLDGAIDYFEDVEEEGGEETTGEEQEEFNDDIIDPNEFEEEEEEPAAETKSKKKEGDDEVEIPAEKKDFFYLPERDAKGLDVFPNEFETRLDAQFGVAEKISEFDKRVEALEELGTGTGFMVDPKLKAQIEKFRDSSQVTAAEAEDLIKFIPQIDASIKGLKQKHTNDQTRIESETERKEIEKDYVEKEKIAFAASAALKLGSRINDLPQGATIEDVLEIVDSQIATELKPLETELSELEQDEEKQKELGHAKYMTELRAKEKALSEKRTDLAAKKKSIEEWWEANNKYTAAKEKTVAPTAKEKMAKREELWKLLVEQKKSGPGAWEIFSSKTTAPMIAFKQFAMKPENLEKFDTTTIEGWFQVKEAWDAEVEKMKQEIKKKEAASKKKKKPIKPPSQQQHSRRNEGLNSDLDSTEADIMQLSRQITQGNRN